MKFKYSLTRSFVSALALFSIGISSASFAADTGITTYPMTTGKLVQVRSLDDRFVSGTSRVMNFFWVEIDAESKEEVWRPVIISRADNKAQAEYYIQTTDGAEIQIVDWEVIVKNNNATLVRASKEPDDKSSKYDPARVKITYFKLETGSDYQPKRYFKEYKSIFTIKKYGDATVALKDALKGK